MGSEFWVKHESKSLIKIYDYLIFSITVNDDKLNNWTPYQIDSSQRKSQIIT